MGKISFHYYIFTESSKKTGLGHLIRCIALYDELEERSMKPILIINGANLPERILGKRIYIIDNWYLNWPKYLNIENKSNSKCVIDSYIADEKTYYLISESCKKALYIDDTNRISYPKGIVVNPSISIYLNPNVTKDDRIYLSGIKYVILRKEFRMLNFRIAKEEINDILVILGGSDIRNLTPLIMNVLNNIELSEINKHIVIGDGFINQTEIEEIARAEKNIKLYHCLDSMELHSLMLKCDFAITAAGQTVFELIATQLPFCCIKIIENQTNNINGLINNKIIFDYLDCSKMSPETSITKVNEYLFKSIFMLKGKVERENQIIEMRKLDIRSGTKNIIDELIGDA